MAKVWFVRRYLSQWVAPGGRPAYERPLETLIAPLDLGPHRLLSTERPHPAPAIAPEDSSDLQKVMVETTEADLREVPFTGYRVGYYDSPYSPREIANRLGCAGNVTAERLED